MGDNKTYFTQEKNIEYIRMNSKAIADHLEHINWNLGKLVALMTSDKELLNKIQKDINERKSDSNESGK